MAKKASGPSADELVTQALVELATSEVPLLLASRSAPALFTSATAAGAKAAIAVLRDETAPLIVPADSSKTPAIRLTPAGFQRVLAHLPEEKVGPAAKAVAAELPASERAAFLNEIVSRTPAAAAELTPLYEAALAAEQAENEARVVAAAKRREHTEVVRQAMARWQEAEERGRKQRIEALERELIAEGGKPPVRTAPPADTTTQPSATPQPRLRPATAEDEGFRRQVARRLVSSWLEAVEGNKAEARQYLETAIWNMSGFRQVGEVGETLPFDGTYHESDVGVSTGASVRVVRPGWVLEEENDREYVVLPARVSG